MRLAPEALEKVRAVNHASVTHVTGLRLPSRFHFLPRITRWKQFDIAGEETADIGQSRKERSTEIVVPDANCYSVLAGCCVSTHACPFLTMATTPSSLPTP